MMWNRARVKTSSLQALKQLARLSRHYKIEKIQRLSANFERACWRTLRCAEERAYHQKYAFIKHCVNVINARRNEVRAHAVPLHNFASHIAEKFRGDNALSLQKKATAQLEALRASLPSCISPDGDDDNDSGTITTSATASTASTVKEIRAKKAELLQRCLDHGVPLDESQEAVCKLIEIARLKDFIKTLSSVYNKRDATCIMTQGYAKHELESMATKHLVDGQLGH